MPDITMPRLSDTMQEGTIARWLKKPGDQVKPGDVLAEIETDKATMDLENYDSGVLEQILVPEGETVPIGQPIAIVGTGQSVQQQASPASPTNVAPPPAAQSQQAHPDSGPEPHAPVSAGSTQPGRTATQATQATQAASTEEHGNGRRAGAIKASPLARHLAEEHNIDLGRVQGSGTGGRIVRDDIEDYLQEQRAAPAAVATAAAQPAPAVKEQPAPAPSAQPPAPQAAPAVPAEEAEVSKLSRVQMLIAKRLSESKQTIPHFYVSAEVDMTDALALRQQFNASAGEEGVKVTVNDLIVKAAALALEKFPEVNSTIKDDQLIKHKHINVGFAVDVPTGLVVPVIPDTNIKGVRSIAREAKALIARAKANKLSTADLEGGTFSVSNLGMMDVSEFIAVINPPQAAILAVASTYKRFVPINDQPVIRDLMTITLSADHRILYGATVARFLQEVKRLLQNPYTLLG